MATEVTVDIGPNGNATISVKGLKGKACKVLTQKFEEGMGRKLIESPTGEFYEQEKVKVAAKG